MSFPYLPTRWLVTTPDLADDPNVFPLIAGQTYQLNVSLQNAAVVTTTVTANNTSSLVADGGEGNDVIQGTLGNDVLNGGNGNDTASFLNAFSGGGTTGVTVDLNNQGTAQNTVAAGNDTLIGIENLVGSTFADRLVGDGSANTIVSGGGLDRILGSSGDDVIVLTDTVEAVKGGSGHDRVVVEQRLDGLTDDTSDASDASYAEALTTRSTDPRKSTK